MPIASSKESMTCLSRCLLQRSLQTKQPTTKFFAFMPELVKLFKKLRTSKKSKDHSRSLWAKSIMRLKLQLWNYFGVILL